MATNDHEDTAPVLATAVSELAAEAATEGPAGEQNQIEEARKRKVQMSKEMCQIRRVMMQDTPNNQKHDEINRILKRKWTLTLIMSEDDGGEGKSEGKQRKSYQGGVESEAVRQTRGRNGCTSQSCWEGLTDEDLINVCDDVMREKVQ